MECAQLAGRRRRALRALRAVCFGAWLGLCWALPFPGSAAQVLAPSIEQLQMLNELDSDQQQSILDRLRQSPGTASDLDTAPAQQRVPARGSSGANGINTSAAQQAREVPVLHEGDVVLLEMNFPPVAPAAGAAPNPTPAPSPGAAPAAATPSPLDQVATKTPMGPQEPLSDQEKAQLRDLMQLVRSKSPYTLGPDATLVLPGFAPVSLRGLTVPQATARVAAEPAFEQLQVKMTLLPLQKPGVAGLKPFGYALFDEPPSTFAPVTDVPVPADYTVGPGDELTVQLYGSQSRTLRLRVGSDGNVSFPGLGPMPVGGQSFSAARAELERRVAQQMVGVRASVSMGQTRAIRVFVLGEAKTPGSYTVSGLGTMTTALFASGGVKPIGSLRKIQLKRQGAIVRTLDLYDLLLKGDTSNDARLVPGDVIFIPPLTATVAVDGEVRRPAIYEVKGTESATDLIELAGGTSADADLRKVGLTRIDAQRGRMATAIDLTAPGAPSPALHNGDAITIARLPPVLDAAVTIEGHVHAPRSIAWRSGMRLTDVFDSVDDLKPNADLHYLLIRRELPPDRTVAVLSADLARAMAARGGDADIQLMPRDRITIFDFETDRARIIRPIMDELRLQSDSARPTEVVRITGRIKVPGDYPLEPGMRVSDLLRAGGSLQDAAYKSSAELTRYVERSGQRTAQLVNVDLAAIIAGDRAADLPLQSADSLNIKEIPQWSDQEKVTLTGEVRFPGEYTIQRGETLHSVINRAGGLTDLAFAEGSVFTREDLKDREQQQLDMLAKRLQGDLASLALQGAQANQTQAAQALSVGQSLLTQLQSTKAVGRLVIDVDRILAGAPGAEADVILRNGDRLTVPKQRQEVTVLGEVQTVTSHLYQARLTRDDYIAQSGGVTRRADRSQTYVVHADGSVVASGARWYNPGTGTKMRPGDTVVVPLDTERMPALPLWQSVTQIVYNIAIAAAAVHSF